MKHLISWVVLALAFMPGGAALASETKNDGRQELADPMEMVLAVQSSRFHNEDFRSCEKAARTKDYEQWLEHFGKGELPQADKNWCAVLAMLKTMKCVDISHLLEISAQRISMIETEKKMPPLCPYMLAITERRLGPKDDYTAVCYKYFAEQLEGEGNFASAIDCRKRQVSIFEANHGSESHATRRAKMFLEQDTLRLKRKRSRH